MCGQVAGSFAETLLSRATKVEEWSFEAGTAKDAGVPVGVVELARARGLPRETVFEISGAESVLDLMG